MPRRRRPGYVIADRRLAAICASALLARAEDLWTLLPDGCDGRAPFTTFDLAERLDRPLWFAQRLAYCLRLTGAARVAGKAGHRVVYVRA